MAHGGAPEGGAMNHDENFRERMLMLTTKSKEYNDIPHPPLRHGCKAWWRWSPRHKSREVRLYAQRALFHPNWSHGTAAVRGTQEINNSLHYWEIHVSQRLFGTAVMFGVCTASQRLHADTFVNLIGEDECGWGFSHKGLLWHNGKYRNYTEPFRENTATTIGVLFDGNKGTLGFYKDSKWLGVAFRGLDTVTEPLYPIIASTAARSELTLGVTMREWFGLQDRARHAILSSMARPHLLYSLPLPAALRNFLEDAVRHYIEDDVPVPKHANERGTLVPITNKPTRCQCIESRRVRQQH